MVLILHQNSFRLVSWSSLADLHVPQLTTGSEKGNWKYPQTKVTAPWNRSKPNLRVSRWPGDINPQASSSIRRLVLGGDGERNGSPLQCSCLENPRDGGARWAATYGVAQSRTRLTWLSSSSTRGDKLRGLTFKSHDPQT